MDVTLYVSLSREAVKTLEDASPGSQALRNVRIEAEAHYAEAVDMDDPSAETVARTERIEVLGEAKTATPLGTPLGDVVVLSILSGDGSEAISRLLKVANGRVEYTITAGDAARLLASYVEPGLAVVPSIARSAQLTPIGAVAPAFSQSLLSVAAVDALQLATGNPLSRLGFQAGRTSSVEVLAEQLPLLGGVDWAPAHVGIDGRFTTSFAVKQSVAGWVWWLSGAQQLAGFVADDVSMPNRQTIVIPLPALQSAGSATMGEVGHHHGGDVPAKVTEAEVANNPQVYSEDPGAFCRPFSNPERVLSERAFAVIARVQQPDIGAVGSGRTRLQNLLDLDFATTVALDAEVPSTATPTRGTPHSRDLLVRGMLGMRPPIRVAEPPSRVEETRRMPSGRSVMSAERPMQWEDDIAQYQAATVALGHILEFRVRTRSNGYSLGTVASTLTLAPRQAKRIQKISFERMERARRQETTQLEDRISDQVNSERSYDDTVSSYLDEWSRGSSWSTSKAAASGIGFAIPPIIGGIGGGISKSTSGSEQEGGRSIVASEQQRLRDSIRRHGDALRRFESTVVSEVAQEETVTGSTEVLRNPNYGHSLTVIFYQILRHMKVSTEFGGARECLFVPFAIKPFSLQRAYRWREAIAKYVRSSRFGKALRHLRDVATDFQFSDLQPGSRASQRLTYLRGSITLQLAVERPPDLEGAKFDAAGWQMLAPMLGSPALGIWAQLAALSEAQRDAQFQREHAATIAAKWANRIVIKAGGTDLQADCTLATRYGFNQAVRIDFMVPASRAQLLSRTALANLSIEAGSALPPRSVANVTRVSLSYGTRNFERNIDGISGVADMVAPGTGTADRAQVAFPLDAWDYVDEREQLRHSVNELIEHLNEHVEYYHKAIWWSMDRDRLLMLLDGFYVPGTDKVSIASVVDREPMAIIGNSLVYRVGAAFYIGYGKVDSHKALHNLYASNVAESDPLLVSLPTDGLYAQAIMDECLALEEHHGSVDWVLNDRDPELGMIDPSLMMSRRADQTAAITPTTLPGTIINLQNAPNAPAPAGLAEMLGAITNPNAFRDMAGLAGTQANAAAALQSAAALATNFGNQAAALKLAEIADKEKARQSANQQVAAVKSAQQKGLISAEEANQHSNRILEQMHSGTSRTAPHENAAINKAIERVAEPGAGGTVEATTPDGAVKVEFASSAMLTEPEIEEFEFSPEGDASEEIATASADEKWIILLAGYNYLNHARGTTTYGTYARNRAALLLAKNASWKSNTKVRFLLINVGEGKAYVDDRMKGSLTEKNNWREISELQFPATNEDVPLRFKAISISDYPGGQFMLPIEMQSGLLTSTGLEDQPVFSIVHWYNLLRTFGRAAPGSVHEASILSHATIWGPVLVNSFREEAFKSVTDRLNLSGANRQRDPEDVDARADADFVEPSMSAADAQEIERAFASDGYVWLWGCAAFGLLKRLILQLHGQSGFNTDGSTPNSTMFQFKFDTNTEGMQSLKTALADHAFLPSSGIIAQRSLGEFKSFLDFFGGTLYADRLVDAFKVRCFATALGAGSEPDGGAKFVVHQVSPIYEKIVSFYENYMQHKRDPEGRRYIDYKR